MFAISNHSVTSCSLCHCSYIYVTNERQRTISEPRRKNEDTEEAQRRRKQRAKKRKQQMQKKIEENKVPQWCMKSIITEKAMFRAKVLLTDMSVCTHFRGTPAINYNTTILKMN